ncbi:MAG: YIP1 family protein [Planctomycetota bacterium]
MSEQIQGGNRRTVGVMDIPLVVFAPRRMFARVEDVPAWNWPLLVLLVTVTVIGYAKVQTGLIEREVDRQVQAAIVRIDEVQRDVVERSALREMYAQQYKKGEFNKLLARIGAIVAEPAQTLASALVLAAILYGIVALTGRKPEWHTLLTIFVFASFIYVLQLLMMLILMLKHGSLEVYTSLAMLPRVWPQSESVDPVMQASLSGLLTAVDPFRVWFWLIVVSGLRITAQLSGWRVWVTCVLCWLIPAGVRAALAAALVSRTIQNAGGGMTG